MLANGQIFLQELITLLAENKKFPKYSAERRIDIFINFFLKDIIKAKLNDEIHDLIIPEFPLKKNNNYQSTNVDYVCFSKSGKSVYFIELKTDARSIDKGQLEIYQKIKKFNKLLDDIFKIYESKKPKSDYKDKYQFLLEQLSEIPVNPPITITRKKGNRGSYDIEKIETTDNYKKIKLVYIGASNVFTDENKKILGNETKIIELDNVKINNHLSEFWETIKNFFNEGASD